MNFDKPAQTTAMQFFNPSDSEDLEAKLLDEPKATNEAVPDEVVAESDGAVINTISPNPKEPITEFYKRTGHGSVEEFMQDPNNEGKIGRNSKGVPFVRENVEYRVKPNNASSGEGETAKQVVEEQNIPGLRSTTTGQDFLANRETEAAKQAEAAKKQTEIELANAEPVPEAKLDDKPVEEVVKLVSETKQDDSFNQINSKQNKELITATLPEDVKSPFKTVVDEMDALEIEPDGEDFYKKIADDINTKIDAYNTKINAVAEKKITPTFEGFDKFLAVLGASLGAYGSAMTGTPNFALKIVEGAIDRDAQMFLKSKEIRTKSLESQRSDMIMRRGELLQMAQNRTSQMIQSKTFELAKAKGKADVIALDKGLQERIANNLRTYQLATATIVSNIVISDAKIRQSLNTEQRKKMVNSLTMVDSKGEIRVMTAYVARDVDSAKKITEDQKDGLRVISLLDQINELHASPTIFLPAWMGGSDKSELNVLTAELELLLKQKMGMGANYSDYEQGRIKAIVPGTDISDMLYQHQTKSDKLRDEVIAKLERDKSVQSFGEIGNTDVADEILKASLTNIKKFGGRKISKN